MVSANFGSLCPNVTNFGSQNFGYQIWFCTRLVQENFKLSWSSWLLVASGAAVASHHSRMSACAYISPSMVSCRVFIGSILKKIDSVVMASHSYLFQCGRMASEGQGVSSLPLPPMQYINLYNDENVKRGRCPQPPLPIKVIILIVYLPNVAVFSKQYQTVVLLVIRVTSLALLGQSFDWPSASGQPWRIWVLETHKATKNWLCNINSLGPSGAIWRQRSRSTLAQVMACCLMAPSHYLNQCWFIISKV